MPRRLFLLCLTALMCSIAQVQEVQGQQINSEVAVLRAQLETMESYNERLLSTVYWSLGGVFTVVILVAGFGWFANFRFYERDKEALQKELENKITSIIFSVTSDLRENYRQAHRG